MSEQFKLNNRLIALACQHSASGSEAASALLVASYRMLERDLGGERSAAILIEAIEDALAKWRARQKAETRQ